MTLAQNSRREFWPHTVLVHESAADDPMTARVLARLKECKIEHVRSAGGDPIVELERFQTELRNASEIERFSYGKRVLLLTRYKGSWLKACPGTSGHVCCNLWIVNPGEGCPLDCTYCYLQSYLRRNPTLKIYTNSSEMIEAIESRANREPGRLFRVGTGEIFDSLVWDELTDLSLDLVPFFARMPNLQLELKTKTSFVDNLVALRAEHNDRTVVSWSINARSISSRDEAFTATVSERIDAAAKVIDAGYKVGFHLDPLIHFEGWEDEYRDTIRAVFDRIPADRIAWVSVSSLRYQKEMQPVMAERFPSSKIAFGEQFLAKDNKLRYVQPVRFRMLKFVWEELKAERPQLPVYMCMESPAAWRNVAGGPPVAGSELVEVFSRRGRLPILREAVDEGACGETAPSEAAH